LLNVKTVEGASLELQVWRRAITTQNMAQKVLE
jgi:hypothetical protein